MKATRGTGSIASSICPRHCDRAVSRAVAYPSGDALVEVDLVSNTSRTLTKVNSTLARIARFQGMWSAQGVILYGVGSTIFLLPEGGGEPEPLKFDGLVPTSRSFVGTGRGAFSVSRESMLVYISQPDTAPQRLAWFNGARSRPCRRRCPPRARSSHSIRRARIGARAAARVAGITDAINAATASEPVATPSATGSQNDTL